MLGLILESFTPFSFGLFLTIVRGTSRYFKLFYRAIEIFLSLKLYLESNVFSEFKLCSARDLVSDENL